MVLMARIRHGIAMASRDSGRRSRRGRMSGPTSSVSREFIEVGERVLVLARHRGVGRRERRADRATRCVGRSTLRDGRIVRWDAYCDRAEALEAARAGGVGDVAGERGDRARRLRDASAREGIECCAPFCSPDVVWYPTDRWLDGSAYRGHDGMRRLVEAASRRTSMTSAFEVHEIRDAQRVVLSRALT